MKIQAKGKTAEINIELPDEDEILRYRDAALKDIIDKAKQSVIEIEIELNKLQTNPSKTGNK